MSQTPETLAAPLALELTILTGELWRSSQEPGSVWTNIISPSACLTMRTGYDIKNRVEIRATAPRQIKSRSTGESITCSLDRSPEAIARDIINRLLPAARAYLTDSIQYDHEKRKETAITKTRERFIKKYLPEEWRNYSNEPATFHRARDWKSIRAQLTYENKVEIKINVDFMKALEILKYLQEKI